MSINVVVAPEFVRSIGAHVSPARLRAIARKTLRAEKKDTRLSLSIVIVGDAAMRDYNRRFHGTDAPTDVLSFPSSPLVGYPDSLGPPARLVGYPDYLGDILISYETARANARRAGWRVRDELELLVVHGVLHLLGYDDTTEEAREGMWRRQREILGIARLKP